MDTISNRLNYLPYPKNNDVDFRRWFTTYIYHIRNIFAIFYDRLHDIEPFSRVKLNSKERLESFAKYLYKKSSQVI